MDFNEPTSVVLERLAASLRWAADHDDDPAEVLEALAGLVRGIERAQYQQVHRMLDRGATWTDVGRRLGVTRQAATQRFGSGSS